MKFVTLLGAVALCCSLSFVQAMEVDAETQGSQEELPTLPVTTSSGKLSNRALLRGLMSTADDHKNRLAALEQAMQKFNLGNDGDDEAGDEPTEDIEARLSKLEAFITQNGFMNELRSLSASLVPLAAKATPLNDDEQDDMSAKENSPTDSQVALLQALHLRLKALEEQAKDQKVAPTSDSSRAKPDVKHNARMRIFIASLIAAAELWALSTAVECDPLNSSLSTSCAETTSSLTAIPAPLRFAALTWLAQDLWSRTRALIGK